MDILNRICQWPSVGSTPTIYGRVIMSQVNFWWKTLLEWQTYTVDLNNGSLLILLKKFAIINLLMSSFFFYSLSLPPLVSFFVAFLMCPVLGSGHLKLAVTVGVTVVDAWTIPWSGRTTPRSLSVCPTPGSVPASFFIRKPFKQALII